MERGLRILVVDDDKLIRMNLALTFGREGLEVDIASTFAEARSLLRCRGYRLVLTDIDLPDASGLDVLRYAKRLSPTVKVVFVTGSATILSAEEAREAGAEALVLKPFKLTDLVNEVWRLVASEPRAEIELPLARDDRLGMARPTSTGIADGPTAAPLRPADEVIDTPEIL